MLMRGPVAKRVVQFAAFLCKWYDDFFVANVLDANRVVLLDNILQWIFTKSTIRWACSWQKKYVPLRHSFFLKMVLMQIGQFYNTFQTLLPVIQIIQIWAGVSQRGLFKKTIVFNDLESNIESIWSATTIFRDRKCWMTVAERFRKGKRSGPNIIVVIMNIRQCHFIQQLRSASFQYRTYPFSTGLAKVVYSFSIKARK